MLNPEIHSVCICQNVDDVIGLTIEHNIRYVDHLHVWNIGSQDKTESILDDLSRKYHHLHVRHEPHLFSNDLRGDYLREILMAHPSATHYYQLDADEFIVGSIAKWRNQIINSRVVYAWMINFAFEKSREESTLHPFDRSNYQGFQNIYAEVRGFTIPKKLEWHIGSRNSLPLGDILPQNLPFKMLPNPLRFITIHHYPKRSRAQLLKRAKEKEALLKSKLFDNQKAKVDYTKYSSEEVLSLLDSLTPARPMAIFYHKLMAYWRIYIVGLSNLLMSKMALLSLSGKKP